MAGFLGGRGSTLALAASAWLLLGCGVSADPQARARYDADDARCRRMADSMLASARARGGNVEADAYEPARVSCMEYRGWKNGRFQ